MADCCLRSISACSHVSCTQRPEMISSAHRHASRTRRGGFGRRACYMTFCGSAVTNLGLLPADEKHKRSTCSGWSLVDAFHVALASAEPEPSRHTVSPVRQKQETTSAWLRRWSPRSKCALFSLPFCFSDSLVMTTTTTTTKVITIPPPVLL